MIKLTIINLMLLLAPFALGYFHQKATKNVNAVVIFYRYFMTFNMLLAGLFVSTRMIFFGHSAAAISGWNYNPLFILYGLAILSMVILGFFTLFQRSQLMMAPAILWTVFLLLSVSAHAFEIASANIADVGIIMVHIAFDAVITIIMLGFLMSLKSYFKGMHLNHYSAAPPN